MKHLQLPLAALALTIAAALPAHAGSSASSASSEGSSASVGSVSTSFETSSDSSSKTDKVAAGDYKLIEVAQLPERPGMLRMKLQAVAAANDSFFLYVPEQTLAQTPVALGEVVSARTRPYGVEFAKAESGRPFYLVLHDAWYRELQTNAVVL